MAITLGKTLQQHIFKHLESTYPNEGGGFLLGHISGQNVHISDTIQIENVFAKEEQYHRYAMTPG
jgi:proteasome lid subunit RPN8/RPN11